MSKFLEYLKLIPAGLKNPEQVLNGIINQIQFEFNTLPEDEKEEIIRRRLICASCPFMSSNAVKNPAMNYKTDRTDEHCVHCGCPIKTRTASLESKCGIENHNAKNPQHKLPLKWEAYQKPKPTNE